MFRKQTNMQKIFNKILNQSHIVINIKYIFIALVNIKLLYYYQEKTNLKDIKKFFS